MEDQLENLADALRVEEREEWEAERGEACVRAPAGCCPGQHLGHAVILYVCSPTGRVYACMHPAALRLPLRGVVNWQVFFNWLVLDLSTVSLPSAG